MRWLFSILIAGLLIVALLAVWAWHDYQAFLESPLQLGPEPDQTFILTAGTSYPAMVEQLHAAGYTGRSWHWRVLGKLQQPVLKAGEYRIIAATTPLSWLEQLQRGQVIQHQFTIIEGWTSRDLLAKLAAEPLLQPDSQGLTAAQILAEVSTPDTSSWLLNGARQLDQELPEYVILEGMFLPETYSFQRGESDLALLRRAHQALLRIVESAWTEVDVAKTPLEHPYQLLILASIIEKETGWAAEREQIAGVFARRLQLGMLLQTDPTVIYGIGEQYDGNIRRRDLETDTAYNTYTRAGLPPTPIALAGAAAIQAAANPASGSALYFVASGDGGHVFSDTLVEHNRAVQRYLEKLRSSNRP